MLLNDIIITNFKTITDLLIIILIPIIISEILKRILIRFEKKTENLTRHAVDVLIKIIRICTLIVIILGFLDLFGIDLNSIFVSLGLVTVALSLATKELISNLIAGFNIIIEKTFAVGDYIEVNNYAGVVKKIGFRTVELLSKDEIIIIPNIIFSNNPYINYTSDGCLMQNMELSIANNEFTDKNMEIIRDILDKSDLIDHKHVNYTLSIVSFDKDDVKISINIPIFNLDDRKAVVSKLLSKIRSDLIIDEDNKD